MANSGDKKIIKILEKTWIKCQSILNWIVLGSMAYFKPSYGVNGLGIPMGPMDAASLHHSMGYTGIFVVLFTCFWSIPSENLILKCKPCLFQITISPVILDENKEEKGPHLQEPN